MKSIFRCWFEPLPVALLLTTLLLVGCNGDDGTDGVDGTNGVDGVDGVDGEDGQDAPGYLESLVALNPVLDLSNTVSYDATSGSVTVHFFLTDGEGNGVDVTSDAYELRIYVSELIPAEPLSGEGDAWNQLISERGTPAADSPMPGTLTLVDASTGEYTYVLAATLAPSSNVIRLTMRARWRETIDDVRYVFANPVNTSYDFLQSDPATELTSSGADMVTTAACESCHGARIGDVGHGGGYTQTKTCNNCHNVNYMESRNGGEGDLAFMVHRIHDAGTFEQITDHDGNPVDFSELTYPQHIYTCSKCHTDEAPNSDLAYMVPTASNCGSCHADINFETGENHPAGTHPDSECAVCHGPGKSLDLDGTVYNLDIADNHNPDPAPEDVSEFDVSITMDPPANAEYYVAGEIPVVTVTLVDTATGLPVDGSVYTAEQDAAGNAGGGLSLANLFVYGPRADAVPVLTTRSSTDASCSGTPVQGHPLFLNLINQEVLGDGIGDDDCVCEEGEVCKSDDQVISDANGFKYQLMNNIEGLAPGTYMIRFEGMDIGVNDANGNHAIDRDANGDFVDGEFYQTASTAVVNFQVGTADEEHKVSGDACTNCHGDTVMHLEGAHPHHAPFNTDQCLACHDLSGNYGDYIGNRVHAIHRASATGDLKGHDWSEVTFPQAANNCTICHTDTTTNTPVWRTPNEVACGGCHGTDPSADPADFPDADPMEILREAAAAVHMQEMGGTFDATTLDVTRQCIVCHGEGRIADLYDTHHLITFPLPEVVDPAE